MDGIVRKEVVEKSYREQKHGYFGYSLIARQIKLVFHAKVQFTY